jgi:hypothetical protein
VVVVDTFSAVAADDVVGNAGRGRDGLDRTHEAVVRGKRIDAIWDAFDPQVVALGSPS